MLQRLDYDQKDKTSKQVRQEFDSMLLTKAWRISDAAVSRREAAGVATNAPGWWEGEEEASSSFLSSMGITLDN